MRKSAVVLAAFLLAQAPAGAQTTEDDLEEARREREAAQAEANERDGGAEGPAAIPNDRQR